MNVYSVLSCENSLQLSLKFLVLYLGCLTTASGSLGLLNSTKKVINFCNLVDGRRLPKCANQGGFYITLASPLVLSLFLCSFSTFLPKCILDSLLQIFALVKLEYIKWYQSFGYPLGQASINQTHSHKQPKKKKKHKNSQNSPKHIP